MPHFELTVPTLPSLKQSCTTQARENTLTIKKNNRINRNAYSTTMQSTGQVSVFESVDGRSKMLMEKGACWSCLKRGHRIRDCKRKKNCGVNDCTGKHHRTIHEERTGVYASASVCSNLQIDACLLQLQKVKTKKGSVNVMWDNAASISFITNKKAREEKLKGMSIELSIVKVGAKSEKIASKKYRLPIIDEHGQIVEFTFMESTKSLPTFKA